MKRPPFAVVMPAIYGSACVAVAVMSALYANYIGALALAVLGASFIASASWRGMQFYGAEPEVVVTTAKISLILLLSLLGMTTLGAIFLAGWFAFRSQYLAAGGVGLAVVAYWTWFAWAVRRPAN
jgi:hypothetical protein